MDERYSFLYSLTTSLEQGIITLSTFVFKLSSPQTSNKIFLPFVMIILHMELLQHQEIAANVYIWSWSELHLHCKASGTASRQDYYAINVLPQWYTHNWDLIIGNLTEFETRAITCHNVKIGTWHHFAYNPVKPSIYMHLNLNVNQVMSEFIHLCQIKHKHFKMMV